MYFINKKLPLPLVAFYPSSQKFITSFYYIYQVYAKLLITILKDTCDTLHQKDTHNVRYTLSNSHGE